MTYLLKVIQLISNCRIVTQTEVSQLHIPGSLKNSAFFKITLIYSEFTYPHNAPAQSRKLLDMTPFLNCDPLRQECLKSTLYQMGFSHGSRQLYLAYWNYLHRFLSSDSTRERDFCRGDGMSDSGGSLMRICPCGIFLYSSSKSGEADP